MNIKRRTANEELLKYQSIVDKMKKNGGQVESSPKPVPQYGVSFVKG